jgi:hypothetical protein
MSAPRLDLRQNVTDAGNTLRDARSVDEVLNALADGETSAADIAELKAAAIQCLDSLRSVLTALDD